MNIGTSIQDLNKQERMENYNNVRAIGENSNYQPMQNMQGEMAHNAQHQVQQVQHNPYNESAIQQYEPDVGNMDMLAQDLEESDNGEVVEHMNSKRGILAKFVPEKFKDPLLIFILFVILSRPVVREKLVMLVPQLGNTDNASMTTVAMYGGLLSVLFMLSRKYL